MNIIEATSQVAPSDQIALRSISDPNFNWLDKGLQWVVIRPKHDHINVDLFLSELYKLAHDDRYQFHLTRNDATSFYRNCTNLIAFALYGTFNWDKQNLPDIITPDYLLIDLLERPKQFSVVAYNI